MESVLLRRIAIAAWCWVFTMPMAGAPAAWALEARVPCGDASTGLRDCSEVMDRSVDRITERAREVVEGWYRGEGGFYPRTCAVLPNIFNGGVAEIEKNHHQQSCGSWAQLDTKIQVKKKRFSVRVNSNTTVSYLGEFGTRERAYTGGAYVQAVDCWLKKIGRQIRSGALAISACQAMARSLTHDVASLESSLARAVSQVKGVNRREIVNKCDPQTQKALESRGKASDDQMIAGESLTMQYCQIVIERESVEALFQQLAVCELFAQAKKAYDEFDLGMLNEDAVKSRLNHWARACRDSGDPDGCYRSHYLEFITGQIQSRFGGCEGDRK